MSMAFIRLILGLAIVFTSLIGAVSAGEGASETTWERLSRLPLDTIQARDTRIWFGLQHQGRCRVRVQVMDTSQQVVRQLSDELMTRGYYNFYWDKKDDSGQYVPRGLYFYRLVSSCVPETKGKLWTGYKPFERVVRLAVDTSDKEPATTVVVDTPAVRISLDIYTQHGVLIDSLCPDTVLNAGRHRFVWAPEYGTALGEYWVRMKAETFVSEEKIRLR